jgi:hypothetical protein
MKYFQKGGVCIYIRNDVCFNHLHFCNYCKEKILEIYAVQIETTDKRMIGICVYRSPLGDFNHFLRMLDMALLSLHKPSTERYSSVETVMLIIYQEITTNKSYHYY